MLLSEDPGSERGWDVVIQHRHDALQHNWSAIKFCSHQVNGDASDLHTVGQRLTLRVNPRKRRK